MASPANQDPFAAFGRLPGPVRGYLLAQSTVNAFRNLSRDLKPEELSSVSGTVGQIDLGFMPLKELVPQLITKLKWPEDRAKKFAAAVAGYRYLPIADLIGINVWAQIEEWGGDPKKYPTVKIEARKVSTDTLANEIVTDARIQYQNDRIAERVKHLLATRLKGIRDDLELREMFMRQEKIGGAGLAEALADRLLSIMKLKLAGAKVVEGEETPLTQSAVPQKPTVSESKTTPYPLPPTPYPKEKPSPEEALPAAQRFLGPKPTPPSEEPLPPTKKTSPAYTITPEDETEIAALKTEVREKLPAEALAIQKSLEASVESVVRASKLMFPTPELKARLRTMVGGRLRDLRDSAETKVLVMRPVNQNGLGLTPDQATQLINLLEAEFLAFQRQIAAAKKQELATFERAQAAARRGREETSERTEREAMERRYLETVKKSRVLKEKGVILPPSAPTTPYPLPPTPSPKPTPTLSPGSVPPTPAAKPRVEDVKFARKVRGPVEELRAMTITEFRRLSRNPEEATLKIRDKIELLKDESFEKYVQGVRAWQDAEPNRFYLELMRGALETGKPVPEIVKERATANQPSLTLEEFQAILALNSQLRF